MRKLMLYTVLAVVMVTTGCNLSPEKVRDAVVSADGALDDLQARHLQSCQANPQQVVCVRINQAGGVQRLAAQTLNTWCAGPPLGTNQPYAQGGPCSQVAGVEPRMREVLSELNTIMTDVQKIGGN